MSFTLSSPVPVRSILCADDNALLGEVMVQMFRSAGHRAEHVDDGVAAWERLSHNLAAFNVLVTDHHMPGLTGIELVQLLREATYGGLIIAHSSCLTDQLREAYCRLGVTIFVPKTSRPEALLQALHESRFTA